MDGNFMMGKGQSLGYLNMQLEAARSWIAGGHPEQAELLLQKLAGITQGLNTDLRESITGLKNTVQDQENLLSGLNRYLQWFGQNYEITTEMSVIGNIPEAMFSPVVCLQLKRIIQEILTNVRKHAKAMRVGVVIQVNGNRAEISDEDNGIGFDPDQAVLKSGSYGLHIMRERAAEIGANIEICSKLKEGCMENSVSH